MGGEGPTRSKIRKKCTSFFDFFGFEQPLLRYLLKTVLHCKGSGIWVDAITQVVEGKEEDVFFGLLVIFFGFIGDIFCICQPIFLDFSRKLFGFVDEFFWIC